MADLKQFERKMEKTLEVLASDFGTPTPINQVGTIS